MEPGDDPKEADGMIPGRNGGRLRRGGTNRGGPGRPSNEFRRFMAGALGDEEVRTYFKKCLRGEVGPKNHLAALRLASERAFGKPEQPVTMTGPGVAEGWTWGAVLADLSADELDAVTRAADPIVQASRFRPECFEWEVPSDLGEGEGDEDAD